MGLVGNPEHSVMGVVAVSDDAEVRLPLIQTLAGQESHNARVTMVELQQVCCA